VELHLHRRTCLHGVMFSEAQGHVYVTALSYFVPLSFY